MIDKLEQNKIVIGKKQTLRALLKNEAEKVYISKDADFHVTEPIADVCKEYGVEIVYFDNMRDLGTACGIDVNAAAAAVLK
jgi:large subunit ribosomal protein L7A